MTKSFLSNLIADLNLSNSENCQTEWTEIIGQNLQNISRREIATQALIDGYDVYAVKFGYYGPADYLIAVKNTNIKNLVHAWNEQEGWEDDDEDSYKVSDFYKIKNVEELYSKDFIV